MHLADIFSSCDDVSRSGLNRNGIYYISVQNRSNPVPVYCELDTNGGNWLVSYSIKAYLTINIYLYFIKKLKNQFFKKFMMKVLDITFKCRFLLKVIQRRIDGSFNFSRNWVEYQRGFGQLKGNFWLGKFYLTIFE